MAHEMINADWWGLRINLLLFYNSPFHSAPSYLSLLKFYRPRCTKTSRRCWNGGNVRVYKSPSLTQHKFNPLLGAKQVAARVWVRVCPLRAVRKCATASLSHSLSLSLSPRVSLCLTLWCHDIIHQLWTWRGLCGQTRLWGVQSSSN